MLRNSGAKTMSEVQVLCAAFTFMFFDAVYGRECYNYKEEPRVRDCDQGCCGDDYAEYCCDATMQIIGSVIGGCIVMAALISCAYFCYRKKTKRRLGDGPGVLGRLGMRTNNNIGQGRPVPRRPPRLPITGPSQMNDVHNNHAYVSSMHIQPPDYYSSNYNNTMQGVPMIIPTAPMPPPYDTTIAPPPYARNKSVPPPPEYNAVINHMATPGHKSGQYSDTMPSPVD